MSQVEMRKRLLDSLIISENLPDELTIEKIVERGYDYNEKSEKVIEFKVERHPGLEGRPSRGKGFGLSAWWNQLMKYTVNLETNEWVTEILQAELDYDPFILAIEEINTIEESGIMQDLILELGDKNEVIEEVISIIINYCEEWRDENIPDNKWNELIFDLKQELRKQLSISLEI